MKRRKFRTAALRTEGLEPRRVMAADVGMPDIDAGTEPSAFVSSTSSGTVDGVRFRDEDILRYDQDADRWEMYFDGSDVGLSANDVDAVHVFDDGSILLSLQYAQMLPDVGWVEDSDLVRFNPSSLGETTSGSYVMFLDGSDVGLTKGGEDIDAVGFTPDGRLVISTRGTVKVPGLKAPDKDMLVLNDAVFGEETAGTWKRYLDSSDLDLKRGSEDINGTWIDPESGSVHLTTNGKFAVAGATGSGGDIFQFEPTSLGNATSGSFAPFWNAAAAGFGGEDLDGISMVHRPLPTVIATDNTYTVDEDTALIGDILGDDTGDGSDVGAAILVTAIDGEPIGMTHAIDLGSGLVIEVSLSGLVTQAAAAREAFDALGSDDVLHVQFEYSITNQTGQSDTGRVEITIQGTNDAPIATQTLSGATLAIGEAFERVLPAGLFTDVDRNDELATTATLADGSPLPEWLSFDGERFTGTPTAGDEGEFDIRVTATDLAGASASEMFRVVVGELAEFQIELVVRAEATPESDFEVFVAEPDSDDDSGIGRFELLPGHNGLHYSLIRLTDFDFDGTKTPADASDDVVSITFRNDGTDVFNVPLAHGNDNGELIGAWTDADGFDQAQIDALRGGLMEAVIIFNAANPQTAIIGGTVFQPAAELSQLPKSLTEVQVGQSYVVEVWVRDNKPSSLGISSVQVDVLFDAELSSGDPGFAGNEVEMDGAFPFFPRTEFEPGTGGAPTLARLEGASIFLDTGVSPLFAKLGTIHLRADAAGLQLFDLDLIDVRRIGNGNPIPHADVALHARLVEQVFAAMDVE